MGRPLTEIIATFSNGRQKAIQARADELLAEQMTLQQLRKAMGKTQAELAKRTGKPQATISRMEKQSDVLLSNLTDVIEAMGGELYLMAKLPNAAPIRLTGFGDISPSLSTARAAARETDSDGRRPPRKKRSAVQQTG